MVAEGYQDVSTVANADAGEMATRLNVPLDRVNRIIQQALLNTPTYFQSGFDFAKNFSKLPRLTTGIAHLDAALGGGLVAGSLIELVGPCNVGKTQLAHNLVLRAQMPSSEGGLDSDVIFIDTENTFRPSRLENFAPKLGLDPETVLKRVLYSRTIDSEQQLATATKLLYEPYKMIPASIPMPKLMVIDSLVGCFRPEFSGRGELADRQQKLNKFLRLCYKYATLNNAIIVYTNQVITTPTAYGAIYTPCGGNITGHANTYRLKLSRIGDGEARLVKVADSPDVANLTFRYFMRPDGIEADTDDPLYKVFIQKQPFQSEASQDLEQDSDL